MLLLFSYTHSVLSFQFHFCYCVFCYFKWNWVGGSLESSNLFFCVSVNMVLCLRIIPPEALWLVCTGGWITESRPQSSKSCNLIHLIDSDFTFELHYILDFIFVKYDTDIDVNSGYRKTTILLFI